MEKFFCDDTLGKLARKLRLLGFDTKLWDGRVEEDRILLTRSRKRWESYEGESFLLFADTWRKQLEELERRYSINTKAKPFTAQNTRLSQLLVPSNSTTTSKP